MLNKLTKETKKIIYWALIGIGSFLLVFLIIFNGAYWGLHPNVSEWKPDIDINEKSLQGWYDACVSLSVLIPFLFSMLCFTSSKYFYVMTEQEVRNQLDQQLENGYISLEQWIKYNQDIDNNLDKKETAKAKAYQTRVKANKERESQRIKLKEQIREELLKEYEKEQE